MFLFCSLFSIIDVSTRIKIKTEVMFSVNVLRSQNGMDVLLIIVDKKLVSLLS